MIGVATIGAIPMIISMPMETITDILTVMALIPTDNQDLKVPNPTHILAPIEEEIIKLYVIKIKNEKYLNKI